MRLYLLAILGLCGAPLAAQVQARLADHCFGARAAVSLVFENGLREHADVVLPALNEVGFRGTFFIVPGKTPRDLAEARRRNPLAMGGVSWGEWRQAAALGHEMANKSWSHPYLTRVDADGLRRQVVLAQKTIAKKTKQRPVTFAYPFAAHDQRSRELVERTHPFVLQTSIHLGGSGRDVQSAQEWLDQLGSRGDWGVASFQSLADSFSPEDFSSLLSVLAQPERNLWVATYREVASYRALASHLKWDVQTDTEDGFTVAWSLDASQPLPARMSVVLEGLVPADVDAWRFTEKDGDADIRVGDRGEIIVTVDPKSESLRITPGM